MITSTRNRQLKNIKLLLASAKARREQGLFVAEGEKLVSEALPGFVTAVYIAERMSHLADTLFEKSPLTEIVRDDVFDAVSGTVTPQGVLALVRMPVYNPRDIIVENNSERHLYILLDNVKDPGNLGTILRTAEAAGVNGIFLSPGCADIFNPKVVRSTMGSIFRMKFCICSLHVVIEKLKSAGCTVYAAALEGTARFDKVDYGVSSAFVVGNEAGGISKDVLMEADISVKIPMAGKVESLNAAVCAAILMYNPAVRVIRE